MSASDGESPSIDAALLAFLADRQVAGDDGKTFLLGYERAQAVFAITAGLRGDVDHPGFLTFGRYLLTHRFHCDGYALLLPAVTDDAPVYVIEQVAGAQRQHAIVVAGASRHATFDDALIGELLTPVRGLPGVLRRELDQRFDRLQVPLLA